MGYPLRQSTADQEVPLGPFLSSTDGNTELEELTIDNTDIKLFKHGATSLADKNSGGGTHMADGIYYAVLDATDTDTAGGLVIYVHVNGALYARVECTVYPQAVYDAMFAGTGNGIRANVAAVDGSSTAAVNLKQGALSLTVGTAVTGTLDDTAFTTNLTEDTDDHYVDAYLVWVTGNLAGQRTQVTDYDGTTKTLTVVQMTEAPENGDVFVLS